MAPYPALEGLRAGNGVSHSTATVLAAMYISHNSQMTVDEFENLSIPVHVHSEAKRNCFFLNVCVKWLVVQSTPGGRGRIW